MLDDNYRPLGMGGGEPKPPLYPLRLKALIYAFGKSSYEDEVRMAGGKVARG